MKKFKLLSLFAVSLMLLAACGGESEQEVIDDELHTNEAMEALDEAMENVDMDELMEQAEEAMENVDMDELMEQAEEAMEAVQ